MPYHKCAASSCRIAINVKLLMCVEHWALVPLPTRQRVYVAWRKVLNQATKETVREHRAAKQEAIGLVERVVDDENMRQRPPSFRKK